MKHATILAAALAAMAFAPAFADAPTGYAAHQAITFSGYAGETALEYFPALVRLPASYFKTASCQDVAFTDSAGNIIPHEVDSFGASEVLVWVRLPVLSGTDTAITAYFGKNEVDATDFTAADVWTNRYAAVWHMNSDATDSTGHGLAQTSVNGLASLTSKADGVLGNAFLLGDDNFAGVWCATPKTFIDDFVTSPSNITVTGWLKPAFSGKPTHVARLFSWKSNTQGVGFDTFIHNNDGKLYMRGDGSSTYKSDSVMDATVGWKTNEWLHLAVRYDDVNFSAFLDGTAITLTGSGSAVTVGDGSNTPNIGFGNLGGNSSDPKWSFYNGQVDELRLYNGVASDDWLKAEHDTAASSSFASYGEITVVETPVDGTWISTAATANWSDSENWQNGVKPSGFGASVTFASPAGTPPAQTIYLGGAAVPVSAIVQSDSVARTISGGTLVLRGVPDIAVADGGSLTLSEEFDASGLVKLGGGDLVFAAGASIAGDVSVSAGKLVLEGGAAYAAFQDGDPRSFAPSADVLLTHLGISEQTILALDGTAWRVQLNEVQNDAATMISELRFSGIKTGFVVGGYRYLRLPFPLTLSAGNTYTLTAWNGVNYDTEISNMLVASPTPACSVTGVISVEQDAVLEVSSAVVTAAGLSGAGSVVADASRPSQLDLSFADEHTFSGATSGPVGLVKRGNGTLNLSGTGLFPDGVTCRKGLVSAASGETLDPASTLVFGDTTGQNSAGRFEILADGAVISNDIAITRMTTTGLTEQGVYATGSNSLTMRDMTISAVDMHCTTVGSRDGQFAIHAHAQSDGTGPTINFVSNTVDYIDFAARVDGVAGETTVRPENKIVLTDVGLVSRIRKFTVQNSVQNSLGGTVEFAGENTFVADWFDIVGPQSKVVQAPGSIVQANELRFVSSVPTWETIAECNVDWTIGNGALLVANGFPQTIKAGSNATNSVLRIDGGTFKMRSPGDAVNAFQLDSLSVVVGSEGGLVDLVPLGDNLPARSITFSSPISGEGAMTFKGDSSIPEVTLTAKATNEGGLIVASAALNLAASLEPDSDIYLTNGAALRKTSEGAVSVGTVHSSGNAVDVSEGATIAVSQIVETGSGLVKSGAGTLAINPVAGGVSTGTVTVSSGTLSLLPARVGTEVSLVADGGFEPSETLVNNAPGGMDKRSVRDAGWLSTNFSTWIFGPSDENGSGVCCNGSYFSNNSQINDNGAGNYHAAFLRISGSTGPGIVSRTISTSDDNTEVTVEFQFNVRWYDNKQWYAKVGVLFDDSQVYETDVLASANATFKNWQTHVVKIMVPAAGSHTLAFKALTPVVDDANKDCEALIDNVKVGLATVFPSQTQSRLENVVIRLDSGATLNLGDGLDLKLQQLYYDGRKVTGKVSAATHPEFVTGGGCIRTANGFFFSLR